MDIIWLQRGLIAAFILELTNKSKTLGSTWLIYLIPFMHHIASKWTNIRLPFCWINTAAFRLTRNIKEQTGVKGMCVGFSIIQSYQHLSSSTISAL